MNQTTVQNPFPVARAVTGRLQTKFSPLGFFQIVDASGAQVLHTQTLGVGDEITAVYTLSSANHAGALVLQPMTWKNGCRAEMSHVLGSVSFPFLGGTAYQPWPQQQRYNEIKVTFKRTANQAGQITTEVGQNGEANKTVSDVVPSGQVVDPATMDGMTALFLALTENHMSAGGTIVFSGLLPQPAASTFMIPDGLATLLLPAGALFVTPTALPEKPAKKPKPGSNGAPHSRAQAAGPEHAALKRES